MQTIIKTFKSSLMLAMMILMIAAIKTSAATFTVTNTNDSGAGSLRQAVLDANAATNADTIIFDSSFNTPQMITLLSEIRFSPGTVIDTLTITGPGANLLTISGNNATRIFRTDPGDTNSISGMTMIRGNGSDGGAIQNNGILTLTGVNFSENVTNSGGAIHNNGNGTTSGVLTINNCVFTNNQANGTNINGDGGSALESGGGLVNITNSVMTGGSTLGGGGAIRAGGVMNITNTTISNNTSGGAGNSDGGGGINSTGQLTLTNCIISNNTAGEGTNGGGLDNEGQMTLINTIVTGNSAGSNGGGINMGATDAGDFLQITDSTISNNRANTGVNTTGVGGGISVEGNPGVTLTRSTISGNQALNSHPTSTNQGHGGGIYSDGRVIMDNCTVSGNRAAQNFGGVRIPVTFSDSTVINSTIVNNTAGLIGGGIGRNNCSLSCRQLSIGNTIVANNMAPSDPDIRNSPSNSASTQITSLGYNLIEVTTGVFISLAATDIIGVDPNLGPLSFNGGTTRTHALRPGSPAIDAGDPTTFPATDQRGIARPQDGDGNGMARADIGAYERRPTDFVLSAFADFDGDGRGDVSVFRPSTGTWFLQQSTAGFTGVGFGASTDLITPADYDGDGRTDVAVFRPNNGTWYLQRSTLGFTGIAFGQAGDIPVPADYDGDGRADIAVFRPSNGTWYLNRSTLGFTGIVFGTAGDKPVPADYDGDGKAEVAVFRASGRGIWYTSTNPATNFGAVVFGAEGDFPVPADYDGDGKADVAVFRPSTGAWFIQRSASGLTGVQFGQTGDLPTPADYDGDGRTDVAVFRSGTWFLNRSTQGFTGISFGTPTDKPVPNAFVY